MQATVKDESPVKKVIHVEVPAETVQEKLDDAYRELQKSARVKGFRPGKAPRSVLEGMYKQDVKADVTQALLSETLPKAISDAGIKMVGSPSIDPQPVERGKPFVYDATVECIPEIPDVEIAGLSLKKNKYVASDAEIDKQIELLRKNMGHLAPLKEERPAKEGDFVIIDYEGAGQSALLKELARTEDFTLELGSGKILKDFDEKLVGMKAGETKEVEVHFPEDYSNAGLSGKDVTFSVTLKEIREQILPEVDDEFVKDLGDYASLAALKDSIRKNLQDGYDKRAEQELEEQIYRALLDRVDFQVPEVLVQSEVESMVEDAERTLSYRNMSFEDINTSREQMGERYAEPALKQVRRYILLDKIIEQEKLELPDEILEESIANMAASLRQPLDSIRTYYEKDPDRLDMLKHTLLQKEAVKKVRSLGTVEEVEPELEDKDGPEPAEAP
ncbi:MAG: trigger factor [Proteobacteria bacterium]|nr:trigger factor [Pseudomonadota bacterium]